ncbi:MAG: hypothetical protein MHM6MM_006755 [Cercozoa sp. M6MM]
MGKRMSEDEKRQKLLKWFKDSNAVHTKKTLPGAASRATGVAQGTLLDVVDRMAEEGLVNKEKVGAQVLYWLFPDPSEVPADVTVEQRDELVQRVDLLRRQGDQLHRHCEELREQHGHTEEAMRIRDEIHERKEDYQQKQAQLNREQEDEPGWWDKLHHETTVVMPEHCSRWTDNVWTLVDLLRKRRPGWSKTDVLKQMNLPASYDDVDITEYKLDPAPREALSATSLIEVKADAMKDDDEQQNPSPVPLVEPGEDEEAMRDDDVSLQQSPQQQQQQQQQRQSPTGPLSQVFAPASAIKAAAPSASRMRKQSAVPSVTQMSNDSIKTLDFGISP